MTRLLRRIGRLLGLLALFLLVEETRALGAAAPDPLLAAGIALAARRRRDFGGALLAFAGARASLSIDPVLPTLGGFLLLGEGAALAARTFFGERAFVPGLCGALAAVALPILRSVFPGAPGVPELGDLLAGSVGTGILAAVAARFGFSPGRPPR